VKPIDIPVAVTGPGTQPAEDDGAELDILQLPSGMTTYAAPDLPEPDAVQGLEPALDLLSRLQYQLANWIIDGPGPALELDVLDDANRELVDQVLGEGEVSIRFENGVKARIQESVLAGVWRIRFLDTSGEFVCDVLEVGSIPSLVSHSTFAEAKSALQIDEISISEGVLNAPPLVAEINDKVAEHRPGDLPHVINLTLLPQTESDLEFLNQQLGQGVTTILSRGYGNCRISSTGVSNVWWVQYFNSQDNNILNTLEIGDVPAVACAAAEDIADSADRLDEILDIYLNPNNGS
jgi:hydrogenase-1 operon protein HyaF